MKKKSLALTAIAVLMVASIATAATLAFFTDTKSKDNTFTVGNVKIALTEPLWDGKDKDGNTDTTVDQNKLGIAQKATPGVAIAKNPIITNTGSNNAYVRMRVTINHADLFKNAENQCNANDILKTLGEGWTLATSSPVGADKTVTYVYNYQTMLNAGDTGNTTTELFKNVTLPTTFTNTQMEALAATGYRFNIKVTAEAIQADGFVANGNMSAADVALAALPPAPLAAS